MRSPDEVHHVAVKRTRKRFERDGRGCVTTAFNALNGRQGNACPLGEIPLRDPGHLTQARHGCAHEMMERDRRWIRGPSVVRSSDHRRIRARFFEGHAVRRRSFEARERERTFHAREQFRWQTREPGPEGRKRVEGHIGFAALDAPDLAGIDVHATGQLFNAKTELDATRPRDDAKSDERIGRDERARGWGFWGSSWRRHAVQLRRWLNSTEDRRSPCDP